MAALALAVPAAGQSRWPQKPIRLVVPFAAGFSIDVVARAVAEQLSRSLGVPVVVDNKPGGAGIIGTADAAKAAPDGYTLILTTTSVVNMNPHLYPRQPYDAQKDFTPVSHLANLPFVLVTGADSPLHNLAQVIASAKAKPGALSFASWEPGSDSHVHVLSPRFLGGFAGQLVSGRPSEFSDRPLLHSTACNSANA